MPFWTLAAHPASFRVEDNVREQDEDLCWSGGRKLACGDQVAIYKYKGRDRHVAWSRSVKSSPIRKMFFPQGTRLL